MAWVYLTEEHERRLSALLQFFENNPIGDGGGLPQFQRGVIRATTIGSHAAGATQPVQLCDSSWGEISGDTPDAINDSQITIATNIRLYLLPDDGRYAIDQAFTCSDGT